MLMRCGMKRVITPAIFLSASILTAQDEAPTSSGGDGSDFGTTDDAPRSDVITFIETVRTADQGFLAVN